MLVESVDKRCLTSGARSPGTVRAAGQRGRSAPPDKDSLLTVSPPARYAFAKLISESVEDRTAALAHFEVVMKAVTELERAAHGVSALEALLGASCIKI